MNFLENYRRLAAMVDRELPDTLRILPPGFLHKAVGHVLLGGGKRFRAVLCLATAHPKATSGDETIPFQHVQVACALEWLHAYSLVHDDLPALDNDDWRRGKPTLHRQYDEATAILAGDALHAGAFVLPGTLGLMPDNAFGILNALAQASLDMACGQVEDTLEAAGGLTGHKEVLEMIDGKTGALLRASLVIGAVLAGTQNAGDWETFARLLGRCFQIRDDLLDVSGTFEQLGKTPGKDARQHKGRLLEFLGEEKTRRLLADFREQALAMVPALPVDPDFFRDLVNFVADRDS